MLRIPIITLGKEEVIKAHAHCAGGKMEAGSRKWIKKHGERSQFKGTPEVARPITRAGRKRIPWLDKSEKCRVRQS